MLTEMHDARVAPLCLHHGVTRLRTGSRLRTVSELPTLNPCGPSVPVSGCVDLERAAHQHRLGAYVAHSTGAALPRQPNTVCAYDALFVRAEQLPVTESVVDCSATRLSGCGRAFTGRVGHLNAPGSSPISVWQRHACPADRPDRAQSRRGDQE